MLLNVFTDFFCFGEKFLVLENGGCFRTMVVGFDNDFYF